MACLRTAAKTEATHSLLPRAPNALICAALWFCPNLNSLNSQTFGRLTPRATVPGNDSARTAARSGFSADYAELESRELVLSTESPATFHRREGLGRSRASATQSFWDSGSPFPLYVVSRQCGKYAYPGSARCSSKYSRNRRVFAGTCRREGYKANNVSGARS